MIAARLGMASGRATLCPWVARQYLLALGMEGLRQWHIQPHLLVEGIPAGQAEFSSSTTQSYEFKLSNWTIYPYYSGVYVPGQQGGAWYYFESRTLSAGHGVSATTTLTYFYHEAGDIPVPATLALLGLGLAGVGAARRSKPDRSCAGTARFGGLLVLCL